jgi:hypothetical protein
MFVGADQAGLPGFYFNGHGSALRSKNDVRLDEIGETIALGRAFQSLGRQIEASGHAQCVTKEEYQRVANLMEQRPPSASRALREFVRDNLQDPTEAKREPTLHVSEHDAPCRGGHDYQACSCRCHEAKRMPVTFFHSEDPDYRTHDNLPARSREAAASAPKRD